MRRIAIDTNLLVLLTVGLTSLHLVTKHKRTRAFSIADFELLEQIVSKSGDVVLASHVLAETSNLLRQVDSPNREIILTVFKALIDQREEMNVTSRESARRLEFVRLGLSDATLLTIAAQGVCLITTDLDLYLAAQYCGYQSINFNHLRDSG